MMYFLIDKEVQKDGDPQGWVGWNKRRATDVAELGLSHTTYPIISGLTGEKYRYFRNVRSKALDYITSLLKYIGSHPMSGILRHHYPDA